MIETITDQDASDVLREIEATADPVRKGQLVNVLNAYRQQQFNAGRVEFEGEIRAGEELDANRRRMFSDPKTLGLPQEELDALNERLRLTQNPEGERKGYANRVWLAHRTGLPYEQVADNYPIYRDRFADQVYQGAGKGDDNSFYEETRRHIAFEETVEQAAQEGRDAALSGQNIFNSIADAQKAKAADWKDDHTRAYGEAFEAATQKMAPHADLVHELVSALERKMKAGAKEGDDDAIVKAREQLVDMPVADRRLVLHALALRARKAGEGADKGGTLGTRWFAPVVKPATGWLQEAGEAGTRFLAGGFNAAGDVELAIRNVPETGAVTLNTPKLETEAEAREFVRQRIHEAISATASDMPMIPVRSGPDITLSPAQTALIRAAKGRARREVAVGREIAAAAEATDPVTSKTAAAFGTSLAAMGIVAVARAASVPVLAGMYSNIEFEKLRRDYPDMSLGDAKMIASLSGAGQGALDLIGFRALDKLPGVKSLLGQSMTRVLAKRAAGRFLGVQLTETGVEIAQDFTTAKIQEALHALNSDVPGVDWSKEVPFWQSAKDNFLAMIPLTLLGVGVASVQEMRGAKQMLSNERELGRAGIPEAARFKIVDLAAKGDLEGAQVELQKAWANRSPEVARQFNEEETARGIELSNALADAEKRGILAKVEKTDAGYKVTDKDGVSVTVQDRAEAVRLASQHADELERARIDAGSEAFAAISRGEDIFNFDPARRHELDAGKADPFGNWTEEEATQAAITQGVLDGLTEEQARNTTWAVMGSNRMERVERVRDGVVELVNIGRSQLNAGSHVLTFVEEGVHRNWTRGLRDGAWTAQEGLQWARLGERILGEELLPMSDEAALANPRAMQEAIAALVVADAVGRRKDGSRILSGAVTRGLVAEMQKAKQADRGAAGKLRQFLRAWRELFAQVFRRARALAKARKEGKITGDFDAFLDNLLQADPQARHQRAVATEAQEMAEEAGMPFSLVAEKASTVTKEQDAAYMQAVERGDMETAQRVVDEAAKGAGYDIGPVWHGTGNKFTTFERSRIGSAQHVPGERGFSFSDTPERAAEFGPNVARYFLKATPETSLGLRNGEIVGHRGEIVVFDPSQIKSADPITRDDKGNVVPLSKRFKSESDDIRFSLAPRDLLDRVSNRLQSLIRKPEYKEAFYKLAKDRMAKLRADSTTWRGDRIEGLDSMAERDRSAGSLQTEAKMRLRMRQRELIEQGMAGLSRATLEAFHSDKALADAREHPVIAHLLTPDPKTPGGWRGRLAHPSRASERTINEYDDMPGGLPNWFLRGGMAPDLAAQELFDAGLIPSPDVQAMWQAIGSAFNSAWSTKGAIKTAHEAVKKIEQDAHAQAKAESEKWLEQARAKVPTQKEKMLAAVRTMEAILSAFPSEVRGKVGKLYPLLQAGSNKGRLRAMLGMIEKLDAILEKHLKAHYKEQFDNLLERAQPKGKPGEGVMGKIGAAAHEWFERVEKAVGMTRQEADERLTEIEGLLSSPDLTPEREAELVDEYLAVQEFGAFATRGSAEMETALKDAQAVFDRGRDSWGAVLAERKALRANIVKQGVREVGNAGRLSDQAKGGAARRKNALSWAADKFLRQIWTWRQTLEATMNRDSAVAVRFHDLARKATREERDAVMRKEAEFQAAMRDEILPGTTRRERNRWLFDFLQPSKTVSVLEDVRTEKLDVPVTIARAIVESANTLAGHNFADAEAAELEAMLAENDALPANRQKDTLPFERTVFGGRRENITLSEAEVAHILMTWGQPEYRAGLERQGFDADAINELSDALTPEGGRFMAWLGRQYREGYAPINAVHVRERGVNLPRVDNYAPGILEHAGEVSEMSLDSPHLQNGNLRNGFTKRRKTHAAPMRLDHEHHSINAVSAYWNHVAQTEHWKAWVGPVNEFKAVLKNKDLRAAVLAAHGQEAVHSLNGWLELFENGGLRSGFENLQQSRLVNRLMRAKARISLMLRLPVYMIQSTASLTALLDLPVKQGLRSMARVMAGQGRMSIKEALNHPVIQRRLRGGFSPEARIAKAAKSGSGGKLDKATASALAKVGLHPTDLEAGMEFGMETIGMTDAFFTSVAAAAAYDAHYAQAESLGLGGAEAEAYATEKMEETVQRTAQPVEGMDRSLVESSPNVLMRLLMMFTSEPRQKVALELAAARQVLKGEAKPSELARMVILNHVVLGSMVWLVRSIARDLLNDDDDNGLEDPAWEAEDWLMSMMLGPFSGLPLMGGAAEWLISSMVGRRPFEDAASPIVGPVKDIYAGLSRSLDGPRGKEQDEAVEFYVKNIGRMIRGIAAGVGGNAAALGVTEQVMEQVFNLGDNAVPDR